jgi:hypothetical protein
VSRVQVKSRPEEDAMHPLFVELFVETDADELLAEDERRRARRASRRRSRLVRTASAGRRDRRPG